MQIDLMVSFPDSRKEIVSALDMLNRVSFILFSAYGEHIRLAAVEKMRWPYPLARDEWGYMRIKEAGSQTLKGVKLRSFSLRLVGMRSKKVVMFGNFTATDQK